MTDDTTRLSRIERIEQRCKERGWLWGNFHEAITDLAIASRVIKFLASGDINPEYNEKIFEFAEALLSLYEPAPVVVIGGTNCTGCQFITSTRCFLGLAKDTHMNWHTPGPDCPGPAPDGKEHVLVLRRKVVSG